MIESSPRLLSAAPGYIGSTDATRATPVLIGLQDFNPEPNTYDCIWIQWVIGHLPDLDYIRFFRRMATALKPGGVVILKDNCSTGWHFVVAKEDSSVARCRDYHKLLFDLAGYPLSLSLSLSLSLRVCVRVCVCVCVRVSDVHTHLSIQCIL